VGEEKEDKERARGKKKKRPKKSNPQRTKGLFLPVRRAQKGRWEETVGGREGEGPKKLREKVNKKKKGPAAGTEKAWRGGRVKTGYKRVRSKKTAYPKKSMLSGKVFVRVEGLAGTKPKSS